MATQPSKTAAKKAARKATKKTAAGQTVTKKTARKSPARKVARNGPAKKGARKIAPVRVEPTTTIIARIDAGFGNDIYLRGSGAGLSWEEGALMENTRSDEWVWQSNEVDKELEFKVLINDHEWSGGPNGVVFPGATVVFEPSF